MPSINLIPENFTIKVREKREKTAIYFLAVFFLLVSAASYVLLEYQRRDLSKQSQVLDAEVTSVRKEITNEIEKSDLLSSEYNKKDIEQVLGEHVYLSKGLSFLKSSILKGAYIKDMDCVSSTDSMKVGVVARDYDTLIKQILVFEDSFWISSVSFEDVAKSKDDGSVSATVSLIFRKDAFAFREQYWDFGTGILSSRTNRYLEISSYSVSLQDDNQSTNTDTGAGSGVKTVVVSFEGKAYDVKYLDSFEKSLNEVGKVNINRFNLADDKPGVVSFRGSLNLNY